MATILELNVSFAEEGILFLRHAELLSLSKHLLLRLEQSYHEIIDLVGVHGEMVHVLLDLSSSFDQFLAKLFLHHNVFLLLGLLLFFLLVLLESENLLFLLLSANRAGTFRFHDCDRFFQSDVLLRSLPHGQ